MTPPYSTRTAPLFPYPPLFRSLLHFIRAFIRLCCKQQAPCASDTSAMIRHFLICGRAHSSLLCLYFKNQVSAGMTKSTVYFVTANVFMSHAVTIPFYVLAIQIGRAHV